LNIQNTNKCNFNLQPFEKFCDGQSVAAKQIVWDECTMTHKKSLEALGHTLQDLQKNQCRFCGGMI